MAWWLTLIFVALGLVLALVLTLVLIRLLCPTLFFKIQTPPGFILHAMTGGNVPPYFWHWPFEDKYFQEWCRDGDVVVCVSAKSGTTWLLNIVHQIRTLGDPKEHLKHNTFTMPWPECTRYPGETVTDYLSFLKTLDGMTNPDYPFRVFKSHYKPRIEGVPWSTAIKTDAVVPVRQRPNVKYVLCMRDGKDVLASFYPFFASHREEFKKLWGGFPPTFKDFNENFKFFTEDQPGFYHGYAAQWWPYRHDPNVLMLHYNDLKKDIKGCLKKIAMFVGVNVPEHAWPLIEEKVSLKWMKEHENIFKYYIETAQYTGNIMKDDEGSMIRKGEIGDGRNKLTPEQEKKWDELNQRFFGDHPGLAEWISTGGPLPPLTETEAGMKAGLTTPLLSEA
eukprot:TRINITY_DN27076_c0_g3_i1.p1 TRINITY_DN27076_c0_g3~~TRINITY_DN27076_c0_g3_i1.p1  ORF type:complete len:391 (+),score=69.16 TRINITY_DN27076_c0_g3_i1:82-1254(+)